MKKFLITQDQWIHTNDGMEFFMPPSIGQGKLSIIELSSGFSLLLSDYKLNDTTCMEYSYCPRGCGFGFCQSGDISSHLKIFAQEHFIHSDQSAFFYIPHICKAKEIVNTKRVRKINIMLSVDRFRESVSFKDFPLNLTEILSRPCHITSTVTPAMRQAFQDIMNCPYQGIVRHFFLEGKAMELIAYKLEQFFSENDIPYAQIDPFVRDEDIERMQHVAKNITNNLDIRLSLSELAANAGVCRSKLHKCFKQVYGLTPFDYARDRRLEKAKQMLRQGENVTQTAFQLGYSSPSHFAKAFKEHFGYLPLYCKKAENA